MGVAKHAVRVHSRHTAVMAKRHHHARAHLAHMSRRLHHARRVYHHANRMQKHWRGIELRTWRHYNKTKWAHHWAMKHMKKRAAISRMAKAVQRLHGKKRAHALHLYRMARAAMHRSKMAAIRAHYKVVRREKGNRCRPCMNGNSVSNPRSCMPESLDNHCKSLSTPRLQVISYLKLTNKK